MEATTHYASQHHDCSLKLPANVAPQFLLARFAWTLFPRIKNFLEADVPRLVRLQEKDVVSEEYEEVDKLLSKKEISTILQRTEGEARVRESAVHLIPLLKRLIRKIQSLTR